MNNAKNICDVIVTANAGKLMKKSQNESHTGTCGICGKTNTYVMKYRRTDKLFLCSECLRDQVQKEDELSHQDDFLPDDMASSFVQSIIITAEAKKLMKKSQMHKRTGVVLYGFDNSGYFIQVMDGNGKIIEEYEAGNNPLDSHPGQSITPEQGALPIEKIEEYCLQTAKEMADEHGIDAKDIVPASPATKTYRSIDKGDLAIESTKQDVIVTANADKLMKKAEDENSGKEFPLDDYFNQTGRFSPKETGEQKIVNPSKIINVPDNKSVRQRMMEENGFGEDDFDANGRYRHPGKFEGETIAIVPFYHYYMNGGGEEFEVSPDDVDLFPELLTFGYKIGETVHLEFSDQGFVSLEEGPSFDKDVAPFYEEEYEEIEEPEVEVHKPVEKPDYTEHQKGWIKDHTYDDTHDGANNIDMTKEAIGMGVGLSDIGQCIVCRKKTKIHCGNYDQHGKLYGYCNEHCEHGSGSLSFDFDVTGADNYGDPGDVDRGYHGASSIIITKEARKIINARQHQIRNDETKEYPCSTCKNPNKLTKKQFDLGLQCFECTDRAVRNDPYENNQEASVKNRIIISDGVKKLIYESEKISNGASSVKKKSSLNKEAQSYFYDILKNNKISRDDSVGFWDAVKKAIEHGYSRDLIYNNIISEQEADKIIEEPGQKAFAQKKQVMIPFCPNPIHKKKNEKVKLSRTSEENAYIACPVCKDVYYLHGNNINELEPDWEVVQSESNKNRIINAKKFIAEHIFDGKAGKDFIEDYIKLSCRENNFNELQSCELRKYAQIGYIIKN